VAFTATRPSKAFLISLAVLLSLFHAVFALTATTEKSTTADEIGHVTAGLAYNTRGDFRLDPPNGNLPQRWAALPMAAAGITLPSVNENSWQTADVWEYGHALFYEQGVRSDEFLWLGRGMITLFSAATGALVFFWSRSLFGWPGAFVSLIFFVFSPTLLAHGALATSDVVMAFFFLAAVGAFWRHLEKPGAVNAALSAITVALAFVAKFSAVLLPAMLAIIAVVWAATQRKARGGPSVILRLARTTLLHVVVSWLVIWTFYELRYSALSPEFTPQASVPDLRSLIPESGWKKVLGPFFDYHLLPEAWLFGLAQVLQFSQYRGAFLNGQYSTAGWFWFFPFAFLVKTTVPFLLACAGIFASGLRSRWVGWRAGGFTGVVAGLRPATPLIVLLLIYGVVSLTSHLNIGHRHLLPLYPPLFIAAGAMGPWLERRRPLAATFVFILLGWQGIESLRIRPHYLAYFNQLVGGPVNGWRHLVDSSLDWGQDLVTLQHWLRQNNPQNEPVFLSYFGSGEPAYEGLQVKRLYSLGLPARPTNVVPLEAGIYCVSATILVQVYSPTAGKWTDDFEREYQQLRVVEPLLSKYANKVNGRKEMDLIMSPERWRSLLERYETLRIARICQYLRVRPADGNAGYSILIYRLSAEEIRRVTGPASEWAALIDEAGKNAR
jgi:4-amino-4-deoxy-L-arabinose transferase-like glycosyltransferase